MQDERHELVDGIIRLLAGGSLDHGTIVGNLFAAFRGRLRGGRGRAFGEGMRVTTSRASMSPDVVVTGAALDPKSKVVPEPRVIVEALGLTVPLAEVSEGSSLGPGLGSTGAR